MYWKKFQIVGVVLLVVVLAAMVFFKVTDKSVQKVNTQPQTVHRSAPSFNLK